MLTTIAVHVDRRDGGAIAALSNFARCDPRRIGDGGWRRGRVTAFVRSLAAEYRMSKAAGATYGTHPTSIRRRSKLLRRQ